MRYCILRLRANRYPPSSQKYLTMNNPVNQAIVIPANASSQWHNARHPPRRRGTHWHASAFNTNSIPYISIAQH